MVHHDDQHVLVGRRARTGATRSGTSAVTSNPRADEIARRRSQVALRRPAPPRGPAAAPRRPARSPGSAPVESRVHRAQRLVPRRPGRATALRSAATSSSPVSRSATGMLYAAESGSNRLRNHIRCWAGDSGIRSGPFPRRQCGSAPRYPPTARPAPRGPTTVGASNSVRTGTARVERRAEPSGDLRWRAASCRPVRRSRRPAPTRSEPEHLGERPRPRSPRPGSVGARNSCASNTGAGSACRSSLPDGVSGNSSSTTTAAGTMYGRQPLRERRAQRVRIDRDARSGTHVRHDARSHACRRSSRCDIRTTTAARRRRGPTAPPRSRRARSAVRGASPGNRCGPGSSSSPSRSPRAPGRRCGTSAPGARRTGRPRTDRRSGRAGRT